MFIGETYISQGVQIHVRLFFMSMAWGIAVAATYDILRLFRRVIKTPRWLYNIQEILFWLTEALLIFRLLYIYDDGAIRSYTMLGLVSGMALYTWFFGRWLPDWLGRKILKIKNSLRNLLKKEKKPSRM